VTVRSFVRALAVAAACTALAACEYFSGVRRTAPRPPDFDRVLAVAALADHPHRSRIDEHADAVRVMAFNDGEAHAWFAYDAQTLEVSSVWTRVPDAALLDRSLKLQDEIIERLRGRWPALPEPAQWRPDWLRNGSAVASREAMLGTK